MMVIDEILKFGEPLLNIFEQYKYYILFAPVIIIIVLIARGLGVF